MRRSIFPVVALCLTVLLSGSVLAEDDPEAAYWSYLEALKSGDVEAVNGAVSVRWRQEIAEMADDLEELLEMISMFLPEEIRIADRQVDAANSTATLRLVGKSQLDGKDMFGTVSLVKEEGRWKIDDESWSDEASD